MALRYAVSGDDTSGWIFLNPAMGTDARKWTEHTLDGRIYRLRCRWIGKLGTDGEPTVQSLWLLDLLDRQGEDLLVGMVIRVGQSLMKPHIGEALPGNGYGQIIAIDSSSRGQDPGRNDLGVRVRLVYVPAVEE